MTERLKGQVKWFNAAKGFGFITPEGQRSGEKDTFVHISDVEQAGMKTLAEGQSVEFEIGVERGRAKAVNLSRVA
jgi:CspA family cold shock protein